MKIGAPKEIARGEARVAEGCRVGAPTDVDHERTPRFCRTYATAQLPFVLERREGRTDLPQLIVERSEVELKLAAAVVLFACGILGGMFPWVGAPGPVGGAVGRRGERVRGRRPARR